jgi:hypothetical protein
MPAMPLEWTRELGQVIGEDALDLSNLIACMFHYKVLMLSAKHHYS